jgi:hypothetical protein
MFTLVAVGDIYFSLDGKQFEITDFWVDQAEPWVKYINTETEKEYTCLHEAFISRFSPTARSY